MDSDVIVAVPALVLVKKTKDMPQFVRNHPLVLAPPKCGDVYLCSRALFVSNDTGVVPIGWIAGKENISLLSGN